MVKFIKIVSFDVKKDDIAAVLETRSLSLEYLCVQKLTGVYEDFLKRYPTSLDQDMALIRDEQSAKKLSYRNYMAIIHRSEQKRILINQIRLCKILQKILERLMRGLTIEFAELRVHEYESQRDLFVNRLMLKNYLDALKAGLKANRDQYYTMHGLNEDEGNKLMKEVQRDMRESLGSMGRKLYEIRGYEKMLSRMMDGQTSVGAAKGLSQMDSV